MVHLNTGRMDCQFCGFAWLDARNRKLKAELLYIFEKMSEKGLTICIMCNKIITHDTYNYKMKGESIWDLISCQ